jgi:hypothetical protein
LAQDFLDLKFSTIRMTAHFRFRLFFQNLQVRLSTFFRPQNSRPVSLTHPLK